MRHGKKVNHLGRKAGHRRALLMNLAQALIEHKRIRTTLAKAKALRVYIEPLVTKAKNNTTHSRRVVFSYLQSKEAIKELFGPIAEKIGDRPGGYVRVIKTGFRQGDGAEMAMNEFVDFNDIYTGSADGQSDGGRRRRRRGGGGSAQKAAVVDKTVTEIEEIEEEVEDIEEDVEDVAEEVVAEAEDNVEEATGEAEETSEEEKKEENE